ncbi:MAG: hypothetical protein JWN04_1613 [Myxococcaceae bacterium]|nr:hypothetical protein [Myxococcaceae bacterium]
MTLQTKIVLGGLIVICSLAVPGAHAALAQTTPSPAPNPGAVNVAPPPAPASATEGASAPPVYASPPVYIAPPVYSAPPPYAGGYPGAPPYAAGPEAARNAYVQNLMFQRQTWLARPVGLGVPITLIAVGAGVAIVGFAVAGSVGSCDPYYDSCNRNTGAELAGVLIGVGGSVMAAVGTGLLIGRIVRRARRGRELRRIDSELRAYGVTASLAPWMSRSGASASAGLTANIRF